MTGFRLKVTKDGFITLSDLKKQESYKTLKGASVNFSNPDSDGIQFSRCLQSLKEGDIIEIRFLPFLPA